MSRYKSPSRKSARWCKRGENKIKKKLLPWFLLNMPSSFLLLIVNYDANWRVVFNCVISSKEIHTCKCIDFFFILSGRIMFLTWNIVYIVCPKHSKHDKIKRKEKQVKQHFSHFTLLCHIRIITTYKIDIPNTTKIASQTLKSYKWVLFSHCKRSYLSP